MFDCRPGACICDGPCRRCMPLTGRSAKMFFDVKIHSGAEPRRGAPGGCRLVDALLYIVFLSFLPGRAIPCMI